MRKKIIATAAALVLGTLMLAGCSQQPAEEPEGEAAVESVEALEGEGEAAADDSEQPAATEGQSSDSSPKPSSGSSGSTSGGSAATTPPAGGSGSSGTAVAPSTPPAHEHSWTYHEAVYVENPVMEKRVVCSCGQMFTSQSAWDAHDSSLGFGEGHSYSYKSVQVGTEKVLASGEYWTCSCGATK